MSRFSVFWQSGVLLGILFPGCVVASGLSVTPFSQELSIQTEERTSFVLNVRNEGEFTTTLQLTPIDFGSLDTSGGVAFLGAQGSPESRYSLADWILLDQSELILDPGATATLNGWILNGERLAPGGHYGAVLFREANQPFLTTETNTLAVDQAFAALLVVKKKGGEIERLSLEHVDFPKSFFHVPKKLMLAFSNEGNVHLTPRGKLSVTDWLGREVAEGILNEESGILLPESERLFPIKPFQTRELLLPGKYFLKVWYRFDGREATEEWEKTLVLVPFSALMGVGILLMLVAWYLRKIWKKRH